MKHKKKGKADPEEAKAKMGVLNDIHKMASDDLGHAIKGIKKVSVMSDSDEGMKEGLQKAGEMVAHKPGHSMADKDANDVSDDMHAESRRHKLKKNSETTDEDDGMADAHGDEEEKGEKAMEGYAKGGMINPGQYGEAQADVVGTPHQNRQNHGMNTKFAAPEMKKEWDTNRYADGGEVEHQHDQSLDFMENGPAEDAKEWGPGRNYADGGMIHPGQYGEAEADEKGVPHQSMQHNNMFAAAEPTIGKERYSSNPHLMGNGSDEHHNKPEADENTDDYGDLDNEDIEALIKHLMAKRKG
jgi:hypothetical protein